MTLRTLPANHDLVQFNVRLLDDASTLVAEYLRRGIAYGAPVAAHLRHVIEHHEALLRPAEPGVVDYDKRAREVALERDPVLVLARLQALRASLRDPTTAAPERALRVRGLCGHNGQCVFEVESTFARELAFVASHAVHHFALLKALGPMQGVDLADCLGADVGKAPATVAHERRLAVQAPRRLETITH